ncbi:hypothetical protein HHK36_018390 [Tetracentron sinense]|uniref:CCHC-type domain-containing protein n=1 Tax=Tetracentron sinense TaxID=13715 RepID=A0A834YVY0_TETSI|nr:hypothetical protein HHK36_018390 [Tetracentron sinense]
MDGVSRISLDLAPYSLSQAVHQTLNGELGPFDAQFLKGSSNPEFCGQGSSLDSRDIFGFDAMIKKFRSKNPTNLSRACDLAVGFATGLEHRDDHAGEEDLGELDDYPVGSCQNLEEISGVREGASLEREALEEIVSLDQTKAQDPIKEGESGKIIYVITASGLGIMAEIVQMWLSATTVDFLAKDYLWNCKGTDAVDCVFAVRHIMSECTSKTMCWNCKKPGHLASECKNDPICHMCGKMGHLARECSGSGLPPYDPRLCNNCYKPGHIAADCTNEKVCNNCRNTGHLARECPNEPVCNTCNVSGHVARQCPKSNHLASEIVGGPFRDIICRNCSQPGHISRDCVAIVICNNCGGRGHQAFECPSGRMLGRGFRMY